MKPPFFIQSVFGILGGIGPHPEDVAHMKRTADRLFGDQYHWSVLGAGRNQLPIAAQALALGGNVRVGLEDSLWSGPGKLAKTNAEQVKLVRSMIEALGFEVADPSGRPRDAAAEGRRQGGVLSRSGGRRHSRQRDMLKACLRHDALSGNPARNSNGRVWEWIPALRFRLAGMTRRGNGCGTEGWRAVTMHGAAHALDAGQGRPYVHNREGGHSQHRKGLP